MRMKFRTRIAILLCVTVFGICVILWRNNITLDCNSDEELCGQKHENLENRNVEQRLALLNPSLNPELMVGMIKDKIDEDIRDEGYKKYAFNDLISRRIGNLRPIPDTRHEICNKLTHSGDLPTASVIICFHNEAWSTLLRTVHTVLDRTPLNLLHEIILVDDFSTEEHLKDQLTQYMRSYSKVSIIRAMKREGLIRGRALGASKATGNVLVFLDSHCEVNVNWLPPLLEVISKDRHTVVCPIIDIINPDTFQYTASPLVKGGFNWGLHFQWEPLDLSTFKREEDYAKPIRSPTMAGGLFAIDTQFFSTLGKYDDGMEIWGGENLEISFRIWMCGGKLEIVPCSRIGHVFRDRRPYGTEGKGDTMSYNSMRLAEVWMDEYKKHFYDSKKYLKSEKYGDVSERHELRRTLKCKSFKWYLYYIYPELEIPSERKGSSLIWRRPSPKTTTVITSGKLGNTLGYCLATGESMGKGITLFIRVCEKVAMKNVWYLDDLQQLKLRAKYCLDVKKPNIPKLMKCHEDGGTQQWLYVKAGRILYHPASGMCLSQSSTENLAMAICHDSDLSQKWKFMNP